VTKSAAVFDAIVIGAGFTGPYATRRGADFVIDGGAMA
jgi:hypothetical protein